MNIIAYFNDLWKWDNSVWTWVSGTNLGNHPGSYEDKGVPSLTSFPSARERSTSWRDRSDGSLWLFGGRDSNFFLLKN